MRFFKHPLFPFVALVAIVWTFFGARSALFTFLIMLAFNWRYFSHHVRRMKMARRMREMKRRPPSGPFGNQPNGGFRNTWDDIEL